MKGKLKIIIIVIVVIALFCVGFTVSALVALHNKSDVEMSMTYLNIPLIDDYFMVTPVVEGASIVETDGIGTWKLSDGTTISVYNSTVRTGVTLVDNDVYIGKNQVERIGQGYTVVVNNEDQLIIDAITNTWSKQLNATGIKTPTWISKYKLDALPLTEGVEGVMSPKGVILPDQPTGSDSKLYTAEIWKQDTSYMSAYIKYDYIDNVRATIYNYLTIDTELNYVPKLTWYDDTQYILATNSTSVMAAKKVTENKFIIYSASIDNLDYVLVNLSDNVITGTTEE